MLYTDAFQPSSHVVFLGLIDDEDDPTFSEEIIDLGPALYLVSAFIA